MSRQVTIVQPYVPAYRVPLFKRLHELLAQDDIDLEIAHGLVHRRGAARGDAVDLDFAKVVGSRQGTVGGHEIRHRRLRTWKAHLVIGEHAIGSMDTYELLVRSGGPTALWGHTRPTDAINHSVVSRLNRWQLRRCRHFFAYTERGRQEAIAWGMDRHAITVLNNTTDTAVLNEAMELVSASDIDALRSRLQLGDGPVVLFIGSLDQAKRPDLFLATLETLRRRDPAIQAVMAGDGGERQQLESAAASRPWLHLVGRVDATELAVLARVADVLLVPAAVGLVAVDSLVLGLPIVTSPELGGHGPEFDYLHDGQNAVFTAGNAEALANGVKQLLVDSERLRRVSAAGQADASSLSIDAMADRFCEGIRAALD